MAEATGNSKFLPKCNRVLSRFQAREAVRTSQSALTGALLPPPSLRQQFQFQYANQAFKPCSFSASLHWSLIPPGSSLENLCPSQVLDNRRKIIGIYNLTEIVSGLCHVSSALPLSRADSWLSSHVGFNNSGLSSLWWQDFSQLISRKSNWTIDLSA